MACPVSSCGIPLCQAWHADGPHLFDDADADGQPRCQTTHACRERADTKLLSDLLPIAKKNEPNFTTFLGGN
eukprot:3483756-Pleurochrysis_carterae.AAC.2